jgi:hypothetical protein
LAKAISVFAIISRDIRRRQALSIRSAITSRPTFSSSPSAMILPDEIAGRVDQRRRSLRPSRLRSSATCSRAHSTALSFTWSISSSGSSTPMRAERELAAILGNRRLASRIGEAEREQAGEVDSRRNRIRFGG